MKGLTGVTTDSPDNRKNVQLSPQETAENVRAITLGFLGNTTSDSAR